MLQKIYIFMGGSACAYRRNSTLIFMFMKKLFILLAVILVPVIAFAGRDDRTVLKLDSWTLLNGNKTIRADDESFVKEFNKWKVAKAHIIVNESVQPEMLIALRLSLAKVDDLDVTWSVALPSKRVGAVVSAVTAANRQEGEADGVVAPDEPASFKGDWIDWIRGHQYYPAQAYENAIQGRCFVELTVGPSGRVVEAVVARTSGDESLDAAALELILAMPAWNPATKNGEAVKSKLVLPVIFTK